MELQTYCSFSPIASSSFALLSFSSGSSVSICSTASVICGATSVISSMGSSCIGTGTCAVSCDFCFSSSSSLSVSLSSPGCFDTNVSCFFTLQVPGSSHSFCDFYNYIYQLINIIFIYNIDRVTYRIYIFHNFDFFHVIIVHEVGHGRHVLYNHWLRRRRRRNVPLTGVQFVHNQMQL